MLVFIFQGEQCQKRQCYNVGNNESETIEKKKESLVQLRIQANGRYSDEDSDICTMAEKSHIKCLLHEKSIKLEVPLIQ